MLVVLLLVKVLGSVAGVEIGLEAICGNKLVGSCPGNINVKVVGGASSCAEKVPWNVLVELVSGPKLTSSGVYIFLNISTEKYLSRCRSKNLFDRQQCM